MIVRNLRASRGRLKAEVVVGTNDLGGNVVLIVDVDRRREDVQQAMTAFENLLLREAQSQIKGASSRTEVDGLARIKAEKLVEAANARSQKAVKSALADAVKAIERVLRTYNHPDNQAVPVVAVARIVTDINQQIERAS